MVGVLEGAGPLADETIVVGAHYDHLGHGGLLSGSLAFLAKDIHNGADDNASGTAMVIELARRLAQRADPCPAASSSSPSRARSAGSSARRTTSSTRSIRSSRRS